MALIPGGASSTRWRFILPGWSTRSVFPGCGIGWRFGIGWRILSVAIILDAWEFQSPWVDNLNSQGLYGVKEQVFNLGESRAEHAAAAALTYVNRLAAPVTSTKAEVIQERAFVVLRCLGWWETLQVEVLLSGERLHWQYRNRGGWDQLPMGASCRDVASRAAAGTDWVRSLAGASNLVQALSGGGAG